MGFCMIMSRYSLTDEAKSKARGLVEIWQHHPEARIWRLTIFETMTRRKELFSCINNRDLTYEISLPVLNELSDCGLIKKDGYDYTLLQSLRDAIDNDFAIPSSSNSTNMISTVLNNSTVLNISQLTGDVHITVNSIADILENQLGEDILASNKELRQSIEELRLNLDDDRPSKLGKVIIELGRSLSHVANATQIISALSAVLPYMTRILGG